MSDITDSALQVLPLHVTNLPNTESAKLYFPCYFAACKQVEWLELNFLR